MILCLDNCRLLPGSMPRDRDTGGAPSRGLSSLPDRAGSFVPAMKPLGRSYFRPLPRARAGSAPGLRAGGSARCRGLAGTWQVPARAWCRRPVACRAVSHWWPWVGSGVLGPGSGRRGGFGAPRGAQHCRVLPCSGGEEGACGADFGVPFAPSPGSR